MKIPMGRIVVFSIFVIAGLMGSAVYWTFKHHDLFTSEVTQNLEKHFYLFSKVAYPNGELAVLGTTLTVPLDRGWSFEVQDKRLVAKAPKLQSKEANPRAPTEMELSATKSVLNELIQNWLRNEFKKKEDVDLLVEIQSEISPSNL